MQLKFILFLIILYPLKFADFFLERDITAATFEQVQYLFQEYKTMRLNWEIPEYGCQVRSHLFTYAAEKYSSIKLSKAIITTQDPSKNFLISSKAVARNYCYRWSFHVAPVIYFAGDLSRSADYYVLDPVLFSVPVPFKTWTKSFSSTSFANIKSSIVSRFKTGPISTRHLLHWDNEGLIEAKKFLKTQNIEYENNQKFTESHSECLKTATEDLITASNY